MQPRSQAFEPVVSPLSACRFCGGTGLHTVTDLGMSPFANNYLNPEQATEPEPFFPLHAVVCDRCWLVQLTAEADPEAIFHDYRYFSSFSDTMLAHARTYAEAMRERFGLGPESLVVEVASNDGYLLQYFKRAGIPVLGIEPSETVARHAIQTHGIETEIRFFSVQTAEALAQQHRKADLIAANNVMAHVPDIRDFVAGFARLLKPEGVVTVEFPSLHNLLEYNQFDTMYHEHYSYLSLPVVARIFEACGLKAFDVEQLPVHGGSLRVYGCLEGAHHAATDRFMALRETHSRLLENRAVYNRFGEAVQEIKRRFLHLLSELQGKGLRIAAYGAPAKGNTLLNYCGIGPDTIRYTADRSPHKQGLLLPGSHIPIHSPEFLLQDKPDIVVILPWNLKEEIMAQLSDIRAYGGRFLVPIPSPELV